MLCAAGRAIESRLADDQVRGAEPVDRFSTSRRLASEEDPPSLKPGDLIAPNLGIRSGRHDIGRLEVSRRGVEPSGIGSTVRVQEGDQFAASDLRAAVSHLPDRLRGHLEDGRSQVPRDVLRAVGRPVVDDDDLQVFSADLELLKRAQALRQQ